MIRPSLRRPRYDAKLPTPVVVSKVKCEARGIITLLLSDGLVILTVDGGFTLN